MNPFYVLFYGVFWCYVQSLPADVFTDVTTCGYVKPIFETKNISTRIPSQPIDGKNSKIILLPDNSFYYQFACC